MRNREELAEGVSSYGKQLQDCVRKTMRFIG